MSKKPSNPLYANVSGVKYKREEPTTRNEPTYYNTVTNKMPQPSQGIYSNVNDHEKSNHMYSNIAKTERPTYENIQYPLYDNLKPLGLLLLIIDTFFKFNSDYLLYLFKIGEDNIRSRPRPVRSSYSELQKAVSYKDGAKYYDNSSSQVNRHRYIIT